MNGEESCKNRHVSPGRDSETQAESRSCRSNGCYSAFGLREDSVSLSFAKEPIRDQGLGNFMKRLKYDLGKESF